MRHYARFVVGHAATVLLLAALVTAGAVWAARRAGFDNSTERMLVRDSPAWRAVEATRAAFGGDEALFVLVRAPDVLQPAVMARLHRLAQAVRRLDGIDRVTSLATLRWPWGSDGDVEVRPLFDEAGRTLPGAPLDAALADPIVRGSLISADRTVAAVIAFVAPRPEDPRFKGRLVEQVEALVADVPAGVEILLGGGPYAQVVLDRITRHDLRAFGIAALLLVGVLLYATYRRAYGVWLPLGTVALALVWTVGAAGVLGISFSVVTSVLVPLLLAVGTSYAVRLLSEYGAQTAQHATRRAAVEHALQQVGLTVILCGVTTAIGFGALCTSRVEVLRDLGTLATCGSAFATLAALTVVPAALALLPLTPPRAATWHGERVLSDRLPGLHALTVRRGGALLAFNAAVMVFGLLGLRRLVVDQDAYTWFPSGSTVERSTRVVDESLGGILPFNIVIESPDGLYDPRLTEAAWAVTRALRDGPDARSVVSLADQLRLVDTAIAPDDAATRARGSGFTRERIAQYLLLYELGDPDLLASFANPDTRRVRVLARLPHGASSQLQAFAETTRKTLETVVPPPLTATLTSTMLLRLETSEEFTRGLTQHLLMAAGAIAIVLAIALRSPRLAVLALVPNLLPILLVYGCLGWLGIPLNVATVTTGAAALGNAVDDTVQYLDRFRRLRRTAPDVLTALSDTLTTVGTPMIVSDLVLVAGFGVFLLSDFLPVASLGLLGATAMLLSLLANLFVLPVLTRHLGWTRGSGPRGQ